jgi:hypothetical protein
MEKRRLLQQMMLGKLAIYMQKAEIRPLSLTLCKKSTSNGSKIFIYDLKLRNYFRNTRKLLKA